MSVVISFFFSSRRRHTRLQGDWSSGRVLFRSRHRFSAARLPPDRKPILFGPGKILKDLEARGGTLTVCDVDRKSTRLNSSHLVISYAVFCLKKKNKSLCIVVDRDASVDFPEVN